MSLLDYFRSNRKTSASVAKERLQILISHERGQRGAPEYLPRLQQELLDVISKYVSIAPADLKVNVEKDNGCEVLEVNVTLPDRQ
ncbi:MAG: cell division topological specificity factor MinE [Gammaproteobacteria bacterium]